MKRFLKPLLISLFVLGFLVRLYRFDNPIADWHAYRQSDTNAVSQIYVRDGINLLYPRYFDISNLQSGKDNPQGLRYVEFPIFNAVQASLFDIFGTLTLVEWGRILSILATLTGAFMVYLLVKKYANEAPAIFAAAFYLLMPFSIYYGRVILPDPSMTAATLVAIYFFDKWIEGFEDDKSKAQNAKYFILTTLFTALAFLLKPYAMIFTLPMVWIVWDKFGLNFFKKWQLWIFAILSLIPLISWRLWISQHPEAVPSSNWLFNGNGIRFHPSFFRWIFYERITKLISGFAGIVFLIDGVFWIFKNKNLGFFASFLTSSLIYLCLIATGNVQHDYYQILIVPTISIFAGLGVDGLLKSISKISNKNVAITVCLVIAVVSFYFSWHYVKDYFNINDGGMVIAGVEANKVLPKDAVVIASHDGSTTMLNLIQRPGWPLFEKDLPILIARGATYMVLADPIQNDINGFARNYKTIASSSSYLILKLK